MKAIALQLPATSDIIVLSPHSDDAAFSVGGLIKTCIDNGNHVTIISCFSLSAYSPRSWGKTNAGRVTAARKEEDRRFSASLGSRCEVTWIDLPDAGLRKDYAKRDMCSSMPLTSNDLLLTSQLCQLLQPMVPTTAVVLVPFGIGFHADHRIVREAGLALLADGSSSLYLYEDPLCRRSLRRPVRRMGGRFFHFQQICA